MKKIIFRCSENMNEHEEVFIFDSTVKDLEVENYITKVTTRNSIYYFEEER